MAKRQFLIYLFPAEWQMGVVGYDYRKDKDGKRLPAQKVVTFPIASTKGKINAMRCMFILSEKDFKAIERDEAFQEVCDFTHMDPGSGEVLKTFEGTILEALRYTDKAFDEYIPPRLS